MSVSFFGLLRWKSCQNLAEAIAPSILAKQSWAGAMASKDHSFTALPPKIVNFCRSHIFGLAGVKAAGMFLTSFTCKGAGQSIQSEGA